ncbi:MAG: glycosyl hydrolase family 18 protein [Bacteroidota bacterium]
MTKPAFSPFHCFLFYFLLQINVFASAQDFLSIHAEENLYYKIHSSPKEPDSYKSFRLPGQIKDNIRVFGYHPYWMNNTWSQYQWNLLTDLCYFSYEVDPTTGNAITTNYFETAAVIDTALTHGIKVHLCVTLFSGHSTFFTNPQARRNLCNQLIEKVKQRGIHGINIDFEAVPSSQGEALTSFMQELRHSIDSASPSTQLSMATPAVNWSNTFHFPELVQICDFFMIMTYDYYWNLSQTAGPVAPLYPMESGYPYGVVRTIQYYLNQGVPKNKVLLGIPYYGRTWPVQSPSAPSNTRGAGSAVTYRSVKSNSSIFNEQTRRYNSASRATYYAYEANGWNHCFIDEQADLQHKYDVVNAYSLRGIGIWALGYDYGFSELWQLIGEAFGSDGSMSCSDSLFDAGGPAYLSPSFSHKPLMISPAGGSPLHISFPELSLSDSRLDVFEGCDTTRPPLISLFYENAGFNFFTDSTQIYLIPRATGPNPKADYCITWRCPSAGTTNVDNNEWISVFPCPATHQLNIAFPEYFPAKTLKVNLINSAGIIVFTVEENPSGKITTLNLPHWLSPGIYLLRAQVSDKFFSSKIVISR